MMLPLTCESCDEQHHAEKYCGSVALAVPFQSINKTLGIGKDEQP